MSHSKFSPSSYYRWSKCPGSIALIEKNPWVAPPSSPYAEEGTRVHALAAAYLVEGKPYLEELDKESSELLGVYTGYVMEKGPECFIEQRVEIPDTGVYGTADCVNWNPRTRTLEIVDLKWGSGVVVEAEGNPQLRIYALGAILSLDLDPVEIICTIVQPRAPHHDGPIRSTKFSATELLSFQKELFAAVDAASDPKAKTVPGDHCRWCPVASICPSLEKQAVAAAKTAFSPGVPYDPKKLGAALAKIELLEAWVDATKSFALSELKQGRKIPGYKLVQTRAIRKWRDVAAAQATLATEFGLNSDQINETAIRSPAQIEKILGKTQTKTESFLGLITQESSGVSMASDNDKRPAVAVETAQMVFKPILGE